MALHGYESAKNARGKFSTHWAAPDTTACSLEVRTTPPISVGTAPLHAYVGRMVPLVSMFSTGAAIAEKFDNGPHPL